MGRSQGQYQGLSQNEEEEGSGSSFSIEPLDNNLADESLPPNPPEYDLGDHPEMLLMDLEDGELIAPPGRFQRLKYKIENRFLSPMKDNVVDPIVQVYQMASAKLDLYLSKLGNPLILRRFVYIVVMSVIAYSVVLSGLMPNNKTTATIGMFSDKHQLIHYARRSIDFAKLEEDLEYLSSMAHLAGTKGDYAITNYIKESFNNNGLKLMKEIGFETYMNYPEEISLNVMIKDDTKIDFKLSTDNFNPLGANGEIKNANLVYAHYGSKADFSQLKERGLLNENTVLIMHYGQLPSEQILYAQKYGAKGILFISKPFGNDMDIVQRMPVGIEQYGTGDPLTPGWSSILPRRAKLEDSKLVPQIPTIPISFRQGLRLKAILSNQPSESLSEDEWPTTLNKDVKCSLKVANSQREKHPSWNIIGKIEGKEQSDKAIIIAAGHDSTCKGTVYPNFGTTVLLSLLQLFQQIKYKYDWKPLRNIYIISYDGSRYNHIGASELFETESAKLKNEVYAFVDVSQLGIDPKLGRSIDVQSTPLLHSFFKHKGTDKVFDVKLRNINQYGDWTPYVANGIPAAILSSPQVLNTDAPIHSCADDFAAWSKLIEENEGVWDLAGDVLIYTFEMVLRLVDEPLLPFNVRDYVDNLDSLLQDLQKQTSGRNLDYQPIVSGLLSWKHIGDEWSSWVNTWGNIVLMEDEGVEPSLLSVHRWTWNKKLTNIMKRQCTSEGIPNRKFYKNAILGPTVWTQDDGHDSWSFPGIRDAVTDNKWEVAQQQINIVGELLLSSAMSFMEESSNSV